MVYFEQRVVLPPETQVRVDTLIRQIDTILALVDTSSDTLNNAVASDTIASFDRTLKSIANTLSPSTVTAFVASFESIANTLDRAVTDSTSNHVDNTLMKIESTFANIDAITMHIRNFTNVVTVLLVGLGISLLCNVVLLFCLRRKSGTIAALKDRSKKSM